METAQKTIVVLVAEDEDINYMYLEALFNRLSQTGFELLRAKNGFEAVDIFQKRSDIDLILMDVRMPVMDGFEAAQKIKSVAPKIPIIIQTAFASLEDQERAFQHGCEGFIVKPLDKDKLFELIDQHISI